MGIFFDFLPGGKGNGEEANRRRRRALRRRIPLEGLEDRVVLSHLQANPSDQDKAHAAIVQNSSGAENHGALVSETAHNTPPGPGHGAAVSQVARENNGHGFTSGSGSGSTSGSSSG